MKRVTIGIHISSEPWQLHATLESLRRATPEPYDLFLLPDGPDRETHVALQRLKGMAQLGTAEPLGAPACFNRLAGSSQTEVLVFLESGALVGPGWLGPLLAALDGDPGCGLAGPSTNLCWNEQAAFPRADGTWPEIVRTADKAAQRFGNTWRTLEPLHSLAAFCYAVRREVVHVIGAADEEYGLGPCWEMDYNIRAARAGYRGVWAGASYVWRAPRALRRQNEEARRFNASKRRYQDKFCALRLRRERTDYETHCRGDACEHFAPAGLIHIQNPFPTSSRGTQPVTRQLTQGSTATSLDLASAQPLISCIMPTQGRPEYVLHSIQLFLRQDYPHKELIIIDDDNQDLTDRLPLDSRLRYLHLPAGTSIGAKRNKACELAKGEIIAQWDDDDWYSPDRLSVQAAPLLVGQADISALTAHIFFDLPTWKFWTCTPELHRRLFVRDVHGGTLVFWRKIWQHVVRYPNRSLAEDAIFLDHAIRRGARLERLINTGQFVYVRHGGNHWRFVCGEYLDRGAWREVPEPDSLATERTFYAACSGMQRDNIPLQSTLSTTAISSVAVRGDLPLVSCIMPTADRQSFVSRAIEYFQRQDYAHKELIIVDDGVDSIQDLLPPDSQIRYIRLDEKKQVGAKRNLACQQAAGEIILHWDDDDWHASRQIAYQAQCLLESSAQVCGIDILYFFDLNTRQAWKYHYAQRRGNWLGGSSLCYFRAYWEKHPFEHLNVGEDTRFIISARPEQILKLPDPTFHIGIIHSGNVSPKRTRGSFWNVCPIQEIQSIMGEDWQYYCADSGQPNRG